MKCLSFKLTVTIQEGKQNKNKQPKYQSVQCVWVFEEANLRLANECIEILKILQIASVTIIFFLRNTKLRFDCPMQ